MAQFIDAADLSRFLGIPVNGSQDEELDRVADSACELVEQWVGPVTPRTITETLSAGQVVRHIPVMSTTSTTHTVDSLTGLVSSTTGAGAVSITYTAGYASPPNWATTAALIIGQHLWRTRRGAGGQRGVSDDAQIVGVGYAIPNQAAAILEPHRRIGFV